jgi:DNA (cytosine-5)-methyltransferase 1
MIQDSREIWSFFSGAMGLDLGLEAAGLCPTLAHELEPVFCQSIRRNRPALDLIEGDVRDLTGDSLRAHRAFQDEVHLMVGGPPCQSFCPGGKRAALTDPRGNLIYEYLRLISEIQPRHFVLENVANLATAALRHRAIKDRPGQHWSLKKYDSAQFSLGIDDVALEPNEQAGSALRQIMTDVGRLGYHLNFGVLDSADYGAPQQRLRFVMLGSRDVPPPALPAPTHGIGLKPIVTVRDAILHLAEAPGPHSEYTEPVRRVFALVPEGKNWRALPKDIQREAMGGSYDAGGGKTGFYRRLGWDKPSPTITGRANRKGSALCHPQADRPLSVRECAALQGFPPDWAFAGSMAAAYTQVGNAVPVALGQAIGSALVAREEAVRPGVSGAVTTNWDGMMATALARLRAAARNTKSKVAA